MQIKRVSKEDLKKYGSPYLLTDKGEHYYKTLINQYLQGLKLNEDTLLILFGLGVYAFRVSHQEDTEMGMKVIEEIKEKLNLDMFDFDNSNVVKIILYQKGYLRDNPDYDEDFSNMVMEYLNHE